VTCWGFGTGRTMRTLKILTIPHQKNINKKWSKAGVKISTSPIVWAINVLTGVLDFVNQGKNSVELSLSGGLTEMEWFKKDQGTANSRPHVQSDDVPNAQMQVK